MNTIVDTKGLGCPQPVILTKKTLSSAKVNEVLEIIIDNSISCRNVERFLRDAGLTPKITQNDNIYTIIVKKISSDDIDIQPQEYCTISKPLGKHVICIKSDKMGSGDDELGEVLLHAFLNILQEADPLPSAVVFYNSGIYLTLKDSPVIESLKEVSGLGVKIYVCGTCTTHFGKTDDVAIGIISNMYDIANVMSKASHVIYP